MYIPLVYICARCTCVITTAIIFLAIRLAMAGDSRATRAFWTMPSTPLNLQPLPSTPSPPNHSTCPQPCCRAGQQENVQMATLDFASEANTLRVRTRSSPLQSFKTCICTSSPSDAVRVYLAAIAFAVVGEVLSGKHGDALGDI